MARLRLSIVDGAHMVEQVFTRFPVRIGRLDENECRILDSSVSRFHARVDSEREELVLRDVGSRNGTILVDIPGRRLRGESVLLSHDAIFVLGRVRVIARVERDSQAELPEEVSAVLRQSSAELLKACSPGDIPVSLGGGPAFSQGVLDALFRNLFRVRTALQSTVGSEETASFREMAQPSEPVGALLTWAQSLGVALRLLERAHEDDAALRECRDTSHDESLLGDGG